MENRTNRITLKTYFQTGKVPTEAQFAELIDSVPNIVDDGLIELEQKVEKLLEQEESVETKQSAFEYLDTPADGEWHNLPVEAAIKDNRTGCRKYQIIVCYKYKKSGKYKAMEVFASHNNGLDLKILSSSKCCGCWIGKILLRWNIEDELFLQLRCRFPKIELLQIRYRITECWNYTDENDKS